MLADPDETSEIDRNSVPMESPEFLVIEQGPISWHFHPNTMHKEKKYIASYIWSSIYRALYV